MAQVACERVAAAIEHGSATSLAQRYRQQNKLTAKDVAEAALRGDDLATQIVRDTGSRLGEALAILVDLINPERIVIGGIAMRLGEHILEPARIAVKREALEASVRVCEILPAALGEAIGDVAAICVAMGL